MNWRNGYSTASRIAAVALTMGAFAAANAQYDLGSGWQLANTGLAPGVGGGGATWTTTWSGGSYNNYAGGIDWNVTSPASVTDAEITMCSSMYQDFSTNTTFSTTKYWLSGTTNNGSDAGTSIKLGDHVEVVALPTADINNPGNETAGNFIKAAELFGHDYNNSLSNNQAAALQLAIWRTLYGGNLVATPNDSGVGSISSFYAAYIADVSNVGVLSASDLKNVDWYDYITPTNGPANGQGQFHWHPGATPEPVTMALGIAALGMAIRRRVKNS